MDNLPLSGRLALVTGAGIGIGQAVADELARQGAAVVLHYSRSAAGALKTAEEINARGGRATTVQADLAKIGECQRLVDEAGSFLGGLDILVNNSGVTARAEFADVTPELFEETFAINFRAQFFCAQRALPLMEKRGGGAILNMASVHAWGGVPSYSVYAATKGAIVAFTRELAVELAPKGIRVNALGPGHIEVPRHVNNPGYDRERAASSIPWGRVGQPSDIASVVAFLVSDAAGYVTGQMFYADGGITAKLALTPAIQVQPGTTMSR
jgi:NAD(P)-dependent dehydrogenase (short-subunit alcohol dehydrogenase family)